MDGSARSLRKPAPAFVAAGVMVENPVHNQDVGGFGGDNGAPEQEPERG